MDVLNTVVNILHLIADVVIGVTQVTWMISRDVFRYFLTLAGKGADHFADSAFSICSIVNFLRFVKESISVCV